MTEDTVVEEHVTDKKFTLYHRGKPIMNWNSIQFLRDWMQALGKSSRGTYINYNDSSIKEYTDERFGQ